MFSRRITQIHQIEMTSRCNLRCRYCTSPKLARPKVDMEEVIYIKSLEWARKFVQRGMQRELNLAGIGESTIHPEFVRFVHLAREYVGPGCDLTFATNGVAVTDEMIRAIAPAKPKVHVSLHRPERAKLAIDILRKYGLLTAVSTDPATAAIDWAGQVEWAVTAPRGDTLCPWIVSGWAMIMADGRVTTCALDASGAGVLGTVHDDLSELETKAYKLCETCDQLPHKGYVRPPREVAVSVDQLKRIA